MLFGVCRIFVSLLIIVGWLTCALLTCSIQIHAVELRGVVTRENVSKSQLEKLANRLRQITGWPGLKFDSNGSLTTGVSKANGGSPSARTLIKKVLSGKDLIVVEDASNRSDVIFSRVVRGRWIKNSTARPTAYIVLVDFADFDYLMGDQRALSAFDVGWALLHELDHVANNSFDAISSGTPGDCEDHINIMRRECNLPLRVEYFFTILPQSKDTVFQRRLVRLAFAEEDPNTIKIKRYWVMWDANVVGGLEERKEIATSR